MLTSATPCGGDDDDDDDWVFLLLKWTALFLNDLTTQTESLVFVKRMLAVAVSSITYLRGIFPEYAYRSRYLEGEALNKWTGPAEVYSN